MVYGHDVVEDTFFIMTSCEFSDLITLYANYFSPLQRILDHMFTTFIYPKSRSRNEVIEVHIFLFYYVMNGILVNMVQLVIDLIGTCRTQLRRSWSYASQLTGVFIYVGINLVYELFIQVRQDDVYNKHKLFTDFGYYWGHDG